MRSIVFSTLALVACSITQVATATPVSAAAAVAAFTASSSSTARSEAIAATAAKSDCGACHQEFFPCEDVKKQGVFSKDCFEFETSKIYLTEGQKVIVFTRKCGKVKRIYRFSQYYAAYRYFLPADKETFNPHYLLEEE